MVRAQLERKDYLKHLRGGVVLTGGGAAMPGAVELASQIFDVPARIGMPPRLGGLSDTYMKPDFTTAIGLVMYGHNQIMSEDIKNPLPRKGNDGFAGKMKNWMKEFF